MVLSPIKIITSQECVEHVTLAHIGQKNQQKEVMKYLGQAD